MAVEHQHTNDFSLERSAGFVGVLTLACLLVCSAGAQSQTKNAGSAQGFSSAPLPNWSPEKLGEPLLRDPIWVYNDWSAYDELSDRIPLTEDLAMRELDQVLRLQKFGVRFDYYMMDAFWFAPDGAYRTGASPTGRAVPTAGSPSAAGTEFSLGFGSARTAW